MVTKMENKKHLVYKEDVMAMAWLSDECDVVTAYDIEDMPTVDAVEVVHGQWIEDGESIYCSACGFETSSLLPYVCDGEKWVPCYANKYCGNCGAKMDR